MLERCNPADDETLVRARGGLEEVIGEVVLDRLRTRRAKREETLREVVAGEGHEVGESQDPARLRYAALGGEGPQTLVRGDALDGRANVVVVVPYERGAV